MQMLDKEKKLTSREIDTTPIAWIQEKREEVKKKRPEKQQKTTLHKISWEILKVVTRIIVKLIIDLIKE